MNTELQQELEAVETGTQPTDNTTIQATRKMNMQSTFEPGPAMIARRAELQANADFARANADKIKGTLEAITALHEGAQADFADAEMAAKAAEMDLKRHDEMIARGA